MDSFVLEKIGPLLWRMEPPADLDRRIADARPVGRWHEVTNAGNLVGISVEAPDEALVRHLRGCREADLSDPARCIILLAETQVAEISPVAAGPVHLIEGEGGGQWIYVGRDAASGTPSAPDAREQSGEAVEA